MKEKDPLWYANGIGSRAIYCDSPGTSPRMPSNGILTTRRPHDERAERIKPAFPRVASADSGASNEARRCALPASLRGEGR
jgi:hypothetical protein